ncbi:PhoX family phosphatase [Phenylobacterium sp.]|uniref:PhoX family protein n=1 Tax=Phenylobacterium sp. TaxID=1871053 RepID=UPI0027305B74|nr:PhoX family phosphatase [Phenylobacterium sp.]MDP1616924.1 PhoX family phosphatase [Phenylobacterium sp.]MDP1986356.1 PhoX family phosphatase [Phenylobacterium sp.]
MDWPERVFNDKGRAAPARTGRGEPISALIDRRRLLLGAAALSLAPVAASAAGGLGFPPLSLSIGPREAIAAGYRRDIVLRWGDPLWSNAAPFDPSRPDSDAAARQFGFNNDYTAFLPLEDGEPDRGLLVVNHEYPNPHLMFGALQEASAAAEMSLEQVRVTMAACGMSVVELRRANGVWKAVLDSPFNRRVTATTPVRISGPAAGHPRLRTAADPSGRAVLGTHDNCNGGVTPWGTVLSGEEGSADFFGGDVSRHPDPAHLARNHYADLEPHGRYGWARADRRFDINHEPNEPNRFEWVVEIDPFDPDAAPVKRTALGRFAHEGAQCALAPDGRVVVYLGDDWEYEYCYRFVTAQPFDPNNRAANRDLLDEGVLSVARFSAEGTVDWLPLVYGVGPLTTENGFHSQGDVLVETRRAADLLGATPMDSPEGYLPDPKTGRIIIALTGADEARTAGTNAANPRDENAAGHLLELVPPDTGLGPDHAADRFAWTIFALCGDPAKPGEGARFHPAAGPEDWFEAPDNLAFDAVGRLWVCTDGPGRRDHDGLWVMATDGEARAWPRLFYSPPAGAECCSPAFTPDGSGLFLAVQHPAEGAASLAEVTERWPERDPALAPRPSVIFISRIDGGSILGQHT